MLEPGTLLRFKRSNRISKQICSTAKVQQGTNTKLHGTKSESSQSSSSLYSSSNSSSSACFKFFACFEVDPWLSEVESSAFLFRSPLTLLTRFPVDVENYAHISVDQNIDNAAHITIFAQINPESSLVILET